MDTEDSVFVEINILTAALPGIHSGTIIAQSSVIFSLVFRIACFASTWSAIKRYGCGFEEEKRAAGYIYNSSLPCSCSSYGVEYVNLQLPVDSQYDVLPTLPSLCFHTMSGNEASQLSGSLYNRHATSSH